MNIYLVLCYEFMKISVFGIGGGLAALPFLYALSDKYGWYTHADLANMVAVAESTPGPIGINMATYVGFTVTGLAGGVLATLSYLLPSILIGITVARFLAKFKASPYVEDVFYGVRPAVCGLIGAAGFKIMSISLLNTTTIAQDGTILDLLHIPAIIMFVVMTALNYKMKWHPVFYIAAAPLSE